LSSIHCTASLAAASTISTFGAVSGASHGTRSGYHPNPKNCHQERQLRHLPQLNPALALTAKPASCQYGKRRSNRLSASETLPLIVRFSIRYSGNVFLNALWKLVAMFGMKHRLP
jgi:hypothetical protein